MTFRVGQKVVCIGRLTQDDFSWPIIPEVGGIYTVRKIQICPYKQSSGVLLEEIICPMNPFFGMEYGFVSEAFRPIVNTDISIFTAMLVPSPKQKVDAE